VNEFAVRVDRELTERFKITVSIRQRCGLLLDLFSLLLEATMSCAMHSVEGGVTPNGHLINSLRFSDEINSVADSPYHLKELTDSGVHDSNQRFGLIINVQTPKTMAIGKRQK